MPGKQISRDRYFKTSQCFKWFWTHICVSQNRSTDVVQWHIKKSWNIPFKIPILFFFYIVAGTFGLIKPRCLRRVYIFSFLCLSVFLYSCNRVCPWRAHYNCIVMQESVFYSTFSFGQQVADRDWSVMAVPMTAPYCTHRLKWNGKAFHMYL